MDVLEVFDGYVDSIDDKTAYVTLESRLNGDILFGQCSSEKLLNNGVGEQDKFLCETIKGGDVRIAPVKKNVISVEDAEAITKTINEAFPENQDLIVY